MKDLSVGKESTQILKFALPMLLGNVFQQLYNVVDSIIVGNFIGKEALAAVGASFPIIFTLISLIIGIAIGFTIIIAQYFGAKDMEKIKQTIDTLYIFLFFASIFVSALGIFFAEEIFQLIKMPEATIPQAKIYLTIYMSGLVFFFGFSGTSAILRGLGDSKTPLYIMIFSTVANIILDLLFVIVLKMGVAGVAFATLISQGVAFIGAIFYLNRTHEVINLSWRKHNFNKIIFKKGIRIGFPIGFQQMFVSLGMMVMFWLVNPFGTNATAAYSVVFRINSFVSLPAMNFAAALSTFVGQNLGANKPERVKKGLLATLKMTAIFAVSMSVISLTLRYQIMSLFTPDADVINIGVDFLYTVGWFYIFFSTMFVIGGVMRGAGDTFIPMIITFISLWIVRVPLCYYLSQKFGVSGVWIGMPFAWFVGLVLSYLYYISGKWKSKVVVKV
ncbi:MAG: MATE family efflux transporter [Bacteroidales bacterium]|nr:MATE family efflux transporter [Bacteroidales bacterium]